MNQEFNVDRKAEWSQ